MITAPRMSWGPEWIPVLGPDGPHVHRDDATPCAQCGRTEFAVMRSVTGIHVVCPDCRPAPRGGWERLGTFTIPVPVPVPVPVPQERAHDERPGIDQAEPREPSPTLAGPGPRRDGSLPPDDGSRLVPHERRPPRRCPPPGPPRIPEGPPPEPDPADFPRRVPPGARRAGGDLDRPRRDDVPARPDRPAGELVVLADHPGGPPQYGPPADDPRGCPAALSEDVRPGDGDPDAPPGPDLRAVPVYRAPRELVRIDGGYRLELDPTWSFAPIAESIEPARSGGWTWIQHPSAAPLLTLRAPVGSRPERCSPSADAGTWWIRTADGWGWTPRTAYRAALEGRAGFRTAAPEAPEPPRAPENAPAPAGPEAGPWEPWTVLSCTADGRAIRRSAARGWVRTDGERGYHPASNLRHVEAKGADWVEDADGANRPNRPARRKPPSRGSGAAEELPLFAPARA